MKLYQLTFLAIFIFCGCSKFETTESIDISSEDNYLNFQILPSDCYHLAYDSSFLETVQNFNFGTLTQKPKLNYYYSLIPKDSNDDSLMLHTAFQFNLPDTHEYPFKDFEIAFVYREAKSSVTMYADSSYSHKDLNTLYEKLVNQSWTPHDNWFYTPEVNFIFSIPNTHIFEDETHNWTYSSNGFFIAHENVELTQVDFNTERQEIIVEGNFELDLKIMSCGYYQFYYVRQAKFKAIIN